MKPSSTNVDPMATCLRPSHTRAALHAIVCLDGSSRSADALAPALALAERRGEGIAVVALHGDADIRNQLEQQMEAVDLDPTSVTAVNSKAEMIALLQNETAQGGTPVLSAFGRWGTTGRLSGIMGELVRSDVSRVLAIGPQATSLAPKLDGCIVVSSDGVYSVDPLMEATSAFVDDATPKILVAHVRPPDEPGMSFSTERDTAKFKDRFDVPVESAAIAGADVGETIAGLARREQASLIITRSWHRWSSRQPSSASNSLSIVAQAPCPVLIVN